MSAAIALALLGGLVLLLWGGGAESLSRWAAGHQREVQEALAAQLRALRSGAPGALAGFLGVCFAYGFFHAAGPGHGKVVIGGYGVARRITMLRLGAIALVASLGQAVTAIVLVVIGALAFQASTAQLTGLAEEWFAPASAAAILLLGLWLVWRGVRRLRAGLWHSGTAVAASGPVVGARALRDPFEAHLAAAPTQRAAQDPDAIPGRVFGLAESYAQSYAADQTGAPAQVHDGHPYVHGAGGICETCGHAHAPDPQAVLAARNWREVLALITAVAIRPCTGALFVLILGLRLQIMPAAIAGTFAMALGTASITIAVAVLSAGLRESSLFAAGGWVHARHLGSVLEVAAGLLVALLAWGLLSAGM